MNSEISREKVLDHGYVILRNAAGPTRRVEPYQPTRNPEYPNQERSRLCDADDTDVPNAARKSFDGMDQDRSYEIEMKLARYLMANKHMTPFEMIQIWLEIKMPIFVARQFVRHRTQAIDEVSARYVALPGEWYIPEMVNIGFQQKDKKQGGRKFDPASLEDFHKAEWFQMALNADCERGYKLYEKAILEGIAMEQARCFLHVNHYTAWISSMNLRNLLHFLVLRDHSHAQFEAQVYAQSITRQLEPILPGIMSLYRDLMKV